MDRVSFLAGDKMPESEFGAVNFQVTGKGEESKP